KVDGVLTTIFQNEIDGPFTIENLQISEWSVGRLYFQWSAIDDSEIRNFAFTTSGEVADFGKLAIVITTYNRQAALLSTLSRFERAFFSDSIYQSKFNVYVVDN
ncbi:hypothetical protein NL310_27735, partial [Klebsiella pneumoniae]|nr:hypothetical protein [Klebsiella pneumoniae]